MKTVLCSLLMTSLATLPVVTCQGAVEKASSASKIVFSAGFAAEDVTPDPGVLMPGYFSRREMEGVLDPLEALCLALSDGENTVFVFAVDNLRLSDAVVAEARRRIAAATGVVAEHTLFNSSHIHTGGDVFADKPAGLEMHPETAEDKARMRAYAAKMAERLAEAAMRAKADLAPAEIRVGRAECPRQAFVRRFRMKNGGIVTNPGVGNPNIVAPAGEGDDTVQVVRFVREGRKDITLINFQNHPDVIGGRKVSADWLGFARRTLVKALDGETECLLVNGAMGDLNHVIVKPRPGEALGRQKGYENSRTMGRMVAGAALRIWGRLDPVPAGKIRCAVKNVSTASNKAPAAEIPEARRIWELHLAHRDNEIPDCAGGRTLAVADARRKVRLENAPASFELPLAAIAIGDSLAFAGIPGQPFARIGRDIKARSPFAMTVIASIANTGLGYFPTEDAFGDGGYEAKTSDFTGNVAADITSGMTGILKDLYPGERADK